MIQIEEGWSVREAIDAPGECRSWINQLFEKRETWMFNKTLMNLVILTSLLIAAPLAFAGAKPADAQAIVKKGIEYYKANGKAKALAAFKDPTGPFVKGDLYIYVLDLNGKVLVHQNANLIGESFLMLRDADGKAFGSEIAEIAKEKGSGWVDYRRENPKTRIVESKTTYLEKSDDLIFCSGAFKQ